MEIYVAYSLIIFLSMLVFFYIYIFYIKILNWGRQERIKQSNEEWGALIDKMIIELDEKYPQIKVIKKLRRKLRNKLKRKITIERIMHYSYSFKGNIRNDIKRFCEDTMIVKYTLEDFKTKDKLKLALSCKILGEFRSERALPKLLSAVDNNFPDVKYNALMAIAKIGNLNAFVESFSKIEDNSTLSERSLIEIVDSFEGDFVLLYKKMILSENDYISTVFIKSLANYMDMQFNDDIVKLLDGKNKDKKIAVIKVLGQTSDVRFIQELIECLNDEAWEIRSMAASSLGRMEDGRALSFLVKALTDRAWWVRFNAAQATFNLSKYLKKMLYSDYKKYISSENMIPISLLAPAYNEEATIVENVKSMLSLKYPLFEVVVVNDGSKDNTLKLLIEAFNLSNIKQPIRYHISTQKVRGIYKNLAIPNLVVIDKENGGKADALNIGINISRYPVFASIDADSILEGESLLRVIMPFIENKETIAVGGIVRIANGSKIKNGKLQEIYLPKNPVAMFQVVEYLRAFLTGRMGWDAMDSLLIISGAFGAFKKQEVISVGGYSVGTVGEDMELVVKLHEYMVSNKKKYNIKFLPDPVCWTQAPERLVDLRNQRRRWQIGLIDSLIRHKKMIFNPKFKMIGLIATPYYWIFEVFGPIIELLGYILIPLSYITGLLNLKFFLLFLCSSILYGVVLSIGAILLEQFTFNKYPSFGQLIKLSVYGILENFGYRQLTLLYRVEGIIKFSSKKNSWGTIKRNSFDKVNQ